MSRRDALQLIALGVTCSSWLWPPSAVSASHPDQFSDRTIAKSASDTPTPATRDVDVLFGKRVRRWSVLTDYRALIPPPSHAVPMTEFGTAIQDFLILRKRSVDPPQGFERFSSKGVRFAKRAIGDVDPLQDWKHEAPEKLRAIMPSEAYLIRDEAGHVALYTSTWIVRFTPGFDPSHPPDHAGAATAQPLDFRRLPSEHNTWLVQFQSASHAITPPEIEEWRRAGVVVHAEPNPITLTTDHICGNTSRHSGLPGCRTNDPAFPFQNNLFVQHVPEAWHLLANESEDTRYGSPSITIGLLDSAMQRSLSTDPTGAGSHQDFPIGGASSTNRFQYVPMPDNGSTDFDHAVFVYGVSGAPTNNSSGLASIASGANHVVAEHAELNNQALYGSQLLWIAGLFGAVPLDKDVPPLPRGCDIINLSHSPAEVGISSYVRDNLDSIARLGRNGLGAIICSGSGNTPRDVSCDDILANCDGCIAVGSTGISDGQREVRARLSGSGTTLDVCALGENIITLSASPADTVEVIADGVPMILRGVTRAFGTSLATPTVAAVAALILTANPSLNRESVVDILLSTADKIDCENNDLNGKWRKRNGEQLMDPVAGERPVPGLEWFSKWYGYGRVNAYEAVKLAIALRGSALTNCVQRQ